MELDRETAARVRAAQDRCALEAAAQRGVEIGHSSAEERVELPGGGRLLVRASADIIADRVNGAERLEARGLTEHPVERERNVRGHDPDEVLVPADVAAAGMPAVGAWLADRHGLTLEDFGSAIRGPELAGGMLLTDRLRGRR
jgi:hypothetical protein